jgi:hypothetical protein
MHLVDCARAEVPLRRSIVAATQMALIGFSLLADDDLVRCDIKPSKT